MTQLERLRQGIIKKHAKGDKESVRILGKRYRELVLGPMGAYVRRYGRYAMER